MHIAGGIDGGGTVHCGVGDCDIGPFCNIALAVVFIAEKYDGTICIDGDDLMG